jgi:hypothetical protein
MPTAEGTIEQVEAVLRQLPPEHLRAVLLFAEFVREQALTQTEDQALWPLVEQEQAYRAAVPEEGIVYTTDEGLLAALDYTE